MGYYIKEDKDMNHNKRKQQRAEALDKVKTALAHPTPSALVYGYLKEKDLNLKDMTVEKWKEIEMDLVEILLSEVYPGEEMPEDQLNFTALMHSFAFMSNFIEALNKNLDLANTSGKDNTDTPKAKEEVKAEEKKDSGPTFEV